MRAILIPCSGRKREGGSSTAASFLKPALSEESWWSLCAARAALAEMLHLEPGPDLGNASSTFLPLLPAWQRYNGYLYENARLAERDVVRPDTRMIVVSALFGIIDVRDSIRKYNLAMTDTLPDGRKVHRFWRDQGLILTVQGLLRGIGAHELHDFLSGSYRRALKGLECGRSVDYAYLPRVYPGLGIGSDYHRGSELRALLDDSASDRLLEGGG